MVKVKGPAIIAGGMVFGWKAPRLSRLMTRELISSIVHAVAGMALGYVVFIDDAERFEWPQWVWILLAGTLVTVVCSRVLVYGRSPLKVRAAVTSIGAIAMVFAPIAWEPMAVRAGHPLLTGLTILTLLLFCNLYFLPAWIAVLLPPRRRTR